jgi:phenylacetate-coenzyme A ligase PaaK-like adenylate-forming protein
MKGVANIGFDINARRLLSLTAAKRNLLAFESINLKRQDAHMALWNLPVTTKLDLLANPSKYYPSNNKFLLNLIKGKTSGTTGTPLSIDRSFNSILWENAFVKQHWESILGAKYKRATLRGGKAPVF